MTTGHEVDVLVLGGGPAGSTAAMLLAEAGVNVHVIEADRHPRFHVGESLLPHVTPLFEKLRVHEGVRALPHTLFKEGASFSSHDGALRSVFWFDQAVAPVESTAYQVRRDEFDALLLRTAAERGARVSEGWHALRPEWEGRRLVGAHVRTDDGREELIRARVVLDATGQAAFLATRMGWRSHYPQHRKVAVVGHFEGVALPKGRESGNVVIVVTESGWFWVIPFRDGTASVGLVMDADHGLDVRGDPDELFARGVAASPEAARLLAGARRLFPAQAVQNFSFRVNRIAGDGFALIGDAAGFLDPIFSTGIFLGMVTAIRACGDIERAFGRRGQVVERDFRGTVALTRDLQRLFFSLIRSYYDPHFLALLFSPRPTLGMQEAVVSLLGGDVLRADRWRIVGKFRLLQGLGRIQGWTDRLGRPLVPPLSRRPGRPMRRAASTNPGGMS
jgi:flavin-dependent dehydrogenase